MDMLTISLFSALEVALLLAVFVMFLRRKNSRLQQQIDDLQREEESDERFESITSGYLPYLEKQIIDTRARLELHEAESSDDERLTTALNYRLGLLEAEKKVTESCNDYPKRRWEHVLEYFTPEIPEEVPAPEPAEEAVTETEPESEPAEQTEQPGTVTQLVNALGQQGDALTEFRNVFEQAKQQPDSEALEKLEQQLKELERRYSEANTCVEILEQENQRLQSELKDEEQRAEKRQHEDAIEFVAQMGKQKQNISELYNMVNELQVEAEKAAELQAQIEQFESNAREMSLCIEIMEEENLFLRDQVQALLQLDQPETDNSELTQRIETMQAELGEKEQKIAQLEANFAAMEKEYVTLYEASKKKGAAG